MHCCNRIEPNTTFKHSIAWLESKLIHRPSSRTSFEHTMTHVDPAKLLIKIIYDWCAIICIHLKSFQRSSSGRRDTAYKHVSIWHISTNSIPILRLRFRCMLLNPFMGIKYVFLCVIGSNENGFFSSFHSFPFDSLSTWFMQTGSSISGFWNEKQIQS